MKRMIFILFFLYLIVAAGFCKEIFAAEDTVTISGEVSEIDNDSITITMGDVPIKIEMDTDVENDVDSDDLIEDSYLETDNSSGSEISANIETGEIVEAEILIKDDKIYAKRIRRAYRNDIICRGAVVYDNNSITCNSITGELLSKANGDVIDTQVIGENGERGVSIESINLSDVLVKFGYNISESTYFVKIIIQCPISVIRGKISEVSDTYIKVNGINIIINENTIIKKFRSLFLREKIDESELTVGSPVRVDCQYNKNTGQYNAIDITIYRTRLVKFSAIIEKFENGTATIQSPGGVLNLPVSLNNGNYKVGDWLNFEGQLSNTGIIPSRINKLGEKSSYPLVKEISYKR